MYLVAGAAYRAMVREGASQSIVINGESGAGELLRAHSLWQGFLFKGGPAFSNHGGMHWLQLGLLQ